MKIDESPDRPSATDAEWSIQELGIADAQRLTPLFDTVWPSNPDNEEDVRWAFQTHPNGSLILAATLKADPTSAVGARGSMPWHLQSAAPPDLVVHQLHGTCVHPDYRRRGIFTQLNVAFLDRFEQSGGDCVFNVSVAESRAGYEKIGWSYLPGLRRLILPARPLRFASAAILNRGEIRGEPIPGGPGDALVDFESVSSPYQARQTQLRDRFATRYDEQFFSWRFSRRNAGYRFVAQDGVGMVSYKIGRRSRLKDLLIGDLWMHRPIARNLARLFWTVLRRERPDVVSLVITRPHPLYRPLRRFGFFPDPKGDLNLGVRPVTPEGEVLLDPERWALMTADIDTF